MPQPKAARSPAPIEIIDDPAELLVDGDGLLDRTFARWRLPMLTTEAVLWFLGIVLVLAGSLYFTKSNWDAWTPGIRAIVVSTGLVLYETMFVGLSWLLSRRDAPINPRRVLAGIGLGLVPMIAVGFSDMAEHGVPFAGALGLGLLAAAASQLGARAFARRLAGPVFLASLATIFAISGTKFLPWEHATTVGCYAVLIILSVLAVRAGRFVGSGPRTCALVYYAYLGATVTGALIGAPEIGSEVSSRLAPPLALVALTVHLASGGTTSGVPRIAVVMFAIVSMAVAATSPLELVSGRVTVLAAAAMSTFALIRRGVLDDRRLPFVLGIGTGLFAYFFIPAPFKLVVELLLSSAKDALGYGNEPLPIAFYGLTFLPYLALLWWAMHRLDKRKREQIAKATGVCLVAISVGLIGLAFTSFDDPRPVLFSLPVYATVYLVEARISGRRWLTHLASLAIAGWMMRAGAEVHPLWGPALGLAVTAVGMSLLALTSDSKKLANPAISHGLAYAGVAIVLGIEVGVGLRNPSEAFATFGAITVAASAVAFAFVAAATRSRSVAACAILAGIAAPLLVVESALHVSIILSGAALVLVATGVILGRLREDTNGISASAGGRLWVRAPWGESPFLGPARHLAPLTALVAAPSLLNDLPLPSPVYLLPATVVLVAAAWTTKWPVWIAAGIASFGALGASVSVELGAHAAWGAVIAALLSVAFTRIVQPTKGNLQRELLYATSCVASVAACVAAIMLVPNTGALRSVAYLGGIMGFLAIPSRLDRRVHLAVTGVTIVGLSASLMAISNLQSFELCTAGLATVCLIAIALGSRQGAMATAALLGAVAAPLLLVTTPVLGLDGAFNILTVGAVALMALGTAVPGRAVTAPAKELAPMVATAAGVLAFTGPEVSAIRFLPVVVVLGLAVWTTRRALWSSPALLGLATLLALASSDLGAHPAWGVALGAVIATLLSRLTSKSDRLNLVLSATSTALCIGAAAFLFTATGTQLALHLAAAIIFLAFAASGLQFLFGASIFLFGVALVWDLADLVGKPHVDDFRLFAWLIIAVVLGTTFLGRWLATSPFLGDPVLVRKHPKPVAPRIIAGATLLILALPLGIATFVGYHPDRFDDAAFAVVCAVAAWFLYATTTRRTSAFLLALWIPLSSAVVGALMFGVSGAFIGLAIGGLLSTLDLWQPPLRPVFRVVGFCAIGFALCGTELSTTNVATPIVLATITIALVLGYQRKPSAPLFAVVTTSAAATLTWAWFVLGTALSTGRPAAAILPFLAIGYAALGFGVKRCRAASAAACSHTLLFAALSCIAANLLFLEHVPLLDRAACLAVLVASVAYWATTARRTGRAVYVVLAEVALAFIWIEIRRRTPSLGAIANIDAYVLLIAAFLFSGLHTIVRRGPGGEVFERSARATALVLPALSALVIPHAVSWNTAGIALLISLAYGVVARMRVSHLATPLATAALNISIILAWLQTGVTDPQIYAAPIGVSLLFLAHLYRAELSSTASATIRLIALGGIYLSGFVSVLAFDAPTHSLIMACICVGGVIAGALLRIRSYLFMGAGFLVVDLGTSIVRFGLTGQTATTIVLTALGLALLGMMVIWSTNRSSIVRSMRLFSAELEAWPL